MNTKGIKFLAVLAVMVMAFAAIVVLAPADNDEAIAVFGNDDVVRDPAVINDDVTADKFYISEDATVKVKDMGNISADVVTFYVQNGVELELDFKATTTSAVVNKAIEIYTVTADQQRITTSTVKDGGENDTVEGKIILLETKFAFTGADKQNVVYTALIPSTVDTITTSTSASTTSTSMVNVINTKVTVGKNNYSYVSAGEKLKSVSTGKYVAVAPGQSIDTDGNVANLVYGIAVKDVESNGTTFTYYATGVNAGSVTIESGETVTIKDGSVIVNNGTASIKATSAKGTSLVLSYTEGQIDVTGTLTAGTMTVSGKVLFNSVTNKATITLNASADVVSGSAMTVTDTLILKNEYEKAKNLKVSGTGFIVAQNEKLWTYEQGTKATLKFAEDSDFAGQYDTTAINATADVEVKFSNAKIEKNQTFRMVGDTTVANEFIIEGVLYIQEGVTLTITQTNNYGASVTIQGQYAQIVNNGTIIIKTTTPYTPEPTTTSAAAEPSPVGLHVYGGTVLNYGTLNGSSLSGAAGAETLVVDYLTTAEYQEMYGDDTTLTAGGFGFVNAGSMSIGKHDTANLDKNFVNKGSVNVTGSLIADALVNEGIFTVSNAKIVTSENVEEFTVTMKKGAVFSIISADVAPGTTIVVQDGLVEDVPTNYVSITADANVPETEKVRISGLTVTDTTNSIGSKLNLSGSVSTSLPQPTDPQQVFKNTLKTKGTVDVTDSLSINKGYALDFEATIMNVSGSVTIAKEVTASNAANLTMFLNGTVIDLSQNLAVAKYIGAKYETLAPSTIYTTVADAVAEAALLEISMVEVGGTEAGSYVTIKEDLVIPEGLTVDGEFLKVDKKATIYVESGGRFAFDKIVIEDGMIAAEDVNDIEFEGIVADVKTEDEESTAAACMSLEVALSIASPGDVIELANTFYAKDVDFVIPEGITVDATAVTGTEFVLVNSDLTVNGVLIVDQFAFIATTDDTIGITVNGFIYDQCSDGACFVPWWYNPFGVSYFFTDDEDHTWFVLTTIENIQPAINVADDAKVTVEGDAYLDELTVSGRDDMPAEVTFKGDVEIGVINIDETALIFKDGKEITTTVRNSVGSITIIGAYVDKYLSIYDMAIYSDVDEGVYMEGVVTDDTYGTYSILFEGVTGMDGTDTKTAINYGNYEDAAPTIVFGGETTVIGKKVYINDDDELEWPVGMTTVSGTLYVANNAKLTINGEVQVLGALMAADRTEEGNPGVINANGNVYIGMLESDIYYLGDAAIFSGEKINLAQGCFIFVAPAAVIDPQIVADLDTMNIFVDDELWFTMYGYETDKFELTGLAVPMTNARLAVVLDEYDDIIDCDIAYGTTNVLVQEDEARTLSGYGNVYIVLNYDIFEVKIKTDGSVKAVYIDGILMETGNVANIFLMQSVAAGTHKVEVEAATGYDADKCVLYTELGTILPGMAFTFTEYDCTEWDGATPVVVYNINGTEIQPEPVPPTPEEESQWTITTILLVILVVLIAIMAVIVALRLNRS